MRVASLHAGTIRGRRNTTGDAQANSVVGNSITIIVATVAGFAARDAAGADSVVDHAVAIIVLTIAGLRNRAMQGIAATVLILINLRIAIVVLVVADFPRIVTKPSTG